MWGVAVAMPYILWWKIENKSDIIYVINIRRKGRGIYI